MTDQEYIEYMQKHYIENNESVADICRDLGITENQMYKRNSKLDIHRPKKLFKKETENKSEEKEYTWEFDFLYGKWYKNKKTKIN